MPAAPRYTWPPPRMATRLPFDLPQCASYSRLPGWYWLPAGWSSSEACRSTGTPSETAATRGENGRQPLHAPVRVVSTGSGELLPIAFRSAAAFTPVFHTWTWSTPETLLLGR